MRISKMEIKKRFGLKTWPFGRPARLAPFVSKALSRISEAVQQAIDENEFIGISGYPGSGKSIAVYDAIERQKTHRRNLHVVDIEDLQTSRITPPKIRAACREALGIQKQLHGSCGYGFLRKALYELYQKGHKAVLVCDEAHALGAEALRALKNMHEWSFDRAQGFISIILVGQDSMVANYRLSARDVVERLQALNLYEMDPLEPHEVREYVKFRIAQVGGKNFFEVPALRLLSQNATTPLAANRLAALMAAHATKSSRRKKTVTLADAEHVLDFTGRRALKVLAEKGYSDSSILEAIRRQGVNVSRSAVNAIRRSAYTGSPTTEKKVLKAAERFAQSKGFIGEVQTEQTEQTSTA